MLTTNQEPNASNVLDLSGEADWIAEAREPAKVEKSADDLDAILKQVGNRIYLRPSEQPPNGVQVIQGKRGGRYYIEQQKSAPTTTDATERTSVIEGIHKFVDTIKFDEAEFPVSTLKKLQNTLNTFYQKYPKCSKMTFLGDYNSCDSYLKQLGSTTNDARIQHFIQAFEATVEHALGSTNYTDDPKVNFFFRGTALKSESYMAKEFDKEGTDFGTRATTCKNIEQVFFHELGHILMYDSVASHSSYVNWQALEHFQDTPGWRVKAALDVSDYAAADIRETFAEVFSLKMQGKPIPSWANAWFNEASISKSANSMLKQIGNKIYLNQNEVAPKGTQVLEGKRGGRYYLPSAAQQPMASSTQPEAQNDSEDLEEIKKYAESVDFSHEDFSSSDISTISKTLSSFYAKYPYASRLNYVGSSDGFNKVLRDYYEKLPDSIYNEYGIPREKYIQESLARKDDYDELGATNYNKIASLHTSFAAICIKSSKEVGDSIKFFHVKPSLSSSELSISTSTKDNLTHELGHILNYDSKFGDAQYVKRDAVEKLEHNWKLLRIIAMREISEYAGASPDECVAEAFVKHSNGETLSPQFENLFTDGNQ